MRFDCHPYRLLLCFFIAVGVFTFSPSLQGARSDQPAAQIQFQRSTVTIVGADGSIKQTLTVELADTMEKRSQGLMFRDDLPPLQGMLFIYDQPRYVVMWMKNTHISLDMIFINSDGQVLQIERATTPYSLRHIKAEAMTQAVLEIKAGLAEKLDIQLGDRVILPGSIPLSSDKTSSP